MSVKKYRITIPANDLGGEKCFNECLFENGKNGIE
jgi:hypothetical protein